MKALSVLPRVLLAGLLGFPMATLAGPALAHDPPEFSMAFTLDDEKLVNRVMMKELVYLYWVEQDPTELPDLDDEAYDRVCEDVKRLFATRGPIKIDQIEVTPVVTNIDFQEGFAENDFLNFVAITLEYGVKGMPRLVAVSWTRYDSASEAWPIEIVGASFEYDTDLQPLEFTEDEPEQIWHAPAGAKRPPVSQVQRVRQSPRWLVPVPSLALLLLLGVAAGVFYSRDVSRKISWVSVILAAATSVLLSTYGVGIVAIAPPWKPRIELPDAEEAKYVFEALHRNVYRAFDYESESEIYEALARSVDDQLLDDVYNEVYQSLILRDEGGAVSKVRGVEVLDSAVAFPEPGQPVFDVDCRWRVTGTVTHWGHSHWRTNQYHALYRVKSDEQNWRITDVEVRSQERISGGDGDASF